MVIDWLREQVEQYRAYLRTKPRVELYQVEIDAFVDWLERTGATPWRSVEDGLPPSTKIVAMLIGTGDWHKGYYGDNPWAGNTEKAWRYSNGERAENVTHYMPIPPLPKESE